MTLPKPEEFTHHHPWLLLAFSRQPDDIGAASLQLWEHLARELISIIGEAGFESLYSRCVFLQQDEFPWLQLSKTSSRIATRFNELKDQLDQQELTLAERASRRMLDTFMRLLSGLIGAGLTKTICQSAWAKVFPILDAEDPSEKQTEQTQQVDEKENQNDASAIDP
ncbi:hypothetical protein [Undibacterium sp.]|uniref:hypothetical protein n=1 Tax=Undibacterium sp. TaxID=1914977 RepID=UPI003750A320